jgi:diacylglycerol kinase (ATP)
VEPISSPRSRKPDLVFVNPAAGGRHAADSLSSLQAFARRTRWSVEFRITTSVQDLEEQASAAAAAGYSRFLVLGGDGSFQDLVNALADFPDAILGILPAGGGNDLADSLGLPHHPVRAAELLQQGEVTYMDAVRVRTSDGRIRLFTGGGGVGLDAQAAHFASTTFRMLTGRLRYLLSAARALIEYQPVQVSADVRFSNSMPVALEATAMIFAILNTPSYGAGLRFAPDATTNDGTLNLVLVEDMPLLPLLRALPRLILFGEVHSPRVKRFPVHHLTIHTDVPRQFHGDGEILGYTPVEIDVVPQAFRILCPPYSPLLSAKSGTKLTK